jgi:hypothetical protein
VIIRDGDNTDKQTFEELQREQGYLRLVAQSVALAIQLASPPIDMPVSPVEELRRHANGDPAASELVCLASASPVHFVNGIGANDKTTPCTSHSGSCQPATAPFPLFTLTSLYSPIV